MEYHNTVGIPLKVNEIKNITILQNQIISRKNKPLCVHYTRKKCLCIRKWDIINGGKYHMILNKVTKSIDFNI